MIEIKLISEKLLSVYDDFIQNIYIWSMLSLYVNPLITFTWTLYISYDLNRPNETINVHWVIEYNMLFYGCLWLIQIWVLVFITRELVYGSSYFSKQRDLFLLKETTEAWAVVELYVDRQSNSSTTPLPWYTCDSQ